LKKKKKEKEAEKEKLKAGSSLRSSVIRTKRKEYLQKRDIRRGKRGRVSEDVLEQKVREEMEDRMSWKKRRKRTGGGHDDGRDGGVKEHDRRESDSERAHKPGKGKKGGEDDEMPAKSDHIAFGEQAYRPPSFSEKSIKFLEKAKEKMKLEQKSARTAVIDQYRLLKQKKMQG
jgi:hypothetical protein